jgi:hypothetical protein
LLSDLGRERPASHWSTVTVLTPTSFASSAWLIPKRLRSARIGFGVMRIVAAPLYA